MKVAKILIGTIAVSIGFGVVIFMVVKGIYDRKRFYNSSINSIAIKEGNWLVHAKTFYLSDGFSVDYMLPVNDKFKLSDSISKPANTYVYKVYRKNSSGKYEFLKEYNFEDAN